MAYSLSGEEKAIISNMAHDYSFLAKRFMDVSISGALLIGLSIPMIIVAVLVKLTSRGPVLYLSDRVGKNNVIFRMPKFRTMIIETPELASDLLEDPSQYLTPIGGFLRKSSLDELPQLWSVFIGKMSLVGPRPALFNQAELIGLRTKFNLDGLLPGITGWAQINGRDELPVQHKVAFDADYLHNRSLLVDVKIMLLTIVKVMKRSGISH